MIPAKGAVWAAQATPIRITFQKPGFFPVFWHSGSESVVIFIKDVVSGNITVFGNPVPRHIPTTAAHGRAVRRFQGRSFSQSPAIDKVHYYLFPSMNRGRGNRADWRGLRKPVVLRWGPRRLRISMRYRYRNHWRRTGAKTPPQVSHCDRLFWKLEAPCYL